MSLLSLLSSPHRATIDLNPAVPVARRMLGELNLTQSIKTVANVLDSSPFANVSLISLKSIPQAYFGERGLVQSFDNGVRCRLRYLESAITSLAAIVYNLAFGAIFSVLFLVTWGKVKTIADEMRKQWTHLALAAGSFGISCAGTFRPQLGIQANIAAGLAIGAAILQMSSTNVVSRICSTYQRNAPALKQSVAQACAAQGLDYNREFARLFHHLDTNLNSRVQTFADLSNAVSVAAAHWPLGVLPSVSLDLIAQNFSAANQRPARRTA